MSTQKTPMVMHPEHPRHSRIPMVLDVEASKARHPSNVQRVGIGVDGDVAGHDETVTENAGENNTSGLVIRTGSDRTPLGAAPA